MRKTSLELRPSSNLGTASPLVPWSSGSLHQNHCRKLVKKCRFLVKVFLSPVVMLQLSQLHGFDFFLKQIP